MIDQLKALLLSFGTVCACVTIIVDKYMVGVGLGPAALRMMYVESPLLDNALCWIYGNSNVMSSIITIHLPNVELHTRGRMSTPI